jgi:hypothetical protein
MLLVHSRDMLGCVGTADTRTLRERRRRVDMGKRRTELTKGSYQDLHDLERDFFITSIGPTPYSARLGPAEAEPPGRAGARSVDR